MNGISKTRRFGPYGLVGGSAVALAAAILAASCGGGGGGGGAGPEATAATIDSASVSSALGDVSAFMPLCNPAAASERARPLAASSFNAVAKLQQVRLAALVLPQKQRALALTSTKPADVLGSCGGRYGYGDYSHVSGVTTGTLVFTDYCTSDTLTGERTTASGRISFVNTATPTPSGPITSKLDANSADGVTAVVRDGTGKVVSSQTVSFTGFSMVMGNPGGTATSASPDRMTLGELKVTNNTSSKTYRQTNWSVASFTTASGGEQTTMSGRGYRSSGNYYDVATTTPLVFDASGNTVSGAITATGANGNNVVVTLVPGATLQASVTVNGAPLAGLPACKR